MASIQDFIQSSAAGLGISEEVVGGATGGLLKLIKEN